MIQPKSLGETTDKEPDTVAGAEATPNSAVDAVPPGGPTGGDEVKQTENDAVGRLRVESVQGLKLIPAEESKTRGAYTQCR